MNEKSNFETVRRAAEIEAAAFSAAGYDSKPRGAAWIYLVLDIAKEYARQDLQFTAADLDQLTAENYHTARHAAETYINLKRYTLPE